MSRRFAQWAGWIWLATAVGVQAIFVQPPEVDVERLLRNTAAYIQEHPRDAQGYYVLARINGLAYALKSKTLPAFEKQPPEQKGLPTLSEMFMKYRPLQLKPLPLPARQLNKNLADAVANFEKAIELSPKNGLYHLGLGYVLEAGTAQTGGPLPFAETPPLTDQQRQAIETLVSKLADQDSKTREAAQKELLAQGDRALVVLADHATAPDTEIRKRVQQITERLWKDKALAAYLDAYRFSIEKDLDIAHKPIEGLNSLVGYEAGQSYLRLLKERNPSAADDNVARDMQKKLAVLDKKPMGPITPIIFSLSHQGSGRLADLLSPNRTAQFDLNGDGAVEAWPWVKAGTCFLVWDPHGTGQITSGRQLFGSVTWWMFWNDGYHALDALDDNRDGQLSGTELRGVAVWRDHTSNGISDPGEVASVSALGIEAIAVRVTHHDGESPASSLGIRFTDGRGVPTFDWIAAPSGRTGPQRN